MKRFLAILGICLLLTALCWGLARLGDVKVAQATSELLQRYPGSLHILGDLEVDGSVTAGSTIVLEGSSVNGSMAVGGDLTVTGSVTGATVVTDGASVNGDIAAAGTVSGATLVVDGASINGAVAASGNISGAVISGDSVVLGGGSDANVPRFLGLDLGVDRHFNYYSNVWTLGIKTVMMDGGTNGSLFGFGAEHDNSVTFYALTHNTAGDASLIIGYSPSMTAATGYTGAGYHNIWYDSDAQDLQWQFNGAGSGAPVTMIIDGTTAGGTAVDNVTFNPAGGDQDFIIETDNEAEALKVDAGNDLVYVGNGIQLDIEGSSPCDGATTAGLLHGGTNGICCICLTTGAATKVADGSSCAY